MATAMATAALKRRRRRLPAGMARGRRHRPASGSDARLKMNARVASESLPIISTAPRENGSNEINHALAFRSHKRLPSPAAPIGPTPPSHAPVGSLARSGSPSVRSGSTIKASKRVLLSPVLSREGTWCFRETYPHLSSLKHATSGLRLAQHLHLRPLWDHSRGPVFIWRINTHRWAPSRHVAHFEDRSRKVGSRIGAVIYLSSRVRPGQELDEGRSRDELTGMSWD